MCMICHYPLDGRQRAFTRPCARKGAERCLSRTLGGSLLRNERRALGDPDRGGRLMISVVLEWLMKKQEQGVERGWKDHTI